jgi:osmotically inducible protein OsmC
MPVRSAHTVWNGSLEAGSGEVELTDSKVGSFKVSWPRRIGEEAEGVTSPEELIAAAHSSCYSMELSALLARAGGTPESLDVTADVLIAPDNPGWRISSIKITVRGKVGGLGEAGFLQAAEAAKESCPVSKALSGVTIKLDAALES